MKTRTLSDLITDYTKQIPKDGFVTLDNILDAFHERGIAFILLLFAAPMALPLPVPPGINIILATPLLLLTAQQIWGAHQVWLPQNIKKRTIASEKLLSMFSALVPWLVRIETLSKPRLSRLTQNGASRFFGLLGFIMALSVCIPLPLTNTVPSLGIALMAIGFIMRDGVAVLIGAFIGTAWVTMLTGAAIIFGAGAIDIVKDAIKSLFA
jgi:hypothetical protein